MKRRRHLLPAVLTALLAAFLSAGCSMRGYLAAEVAGIIDDGMAAFEADDDLELVESAFPGDIKLLEALLSSSPDDRRLLALLARLYGSYAFAFLEPKLERSLLAGEGCGPQPTTATRTTTRESVSRYYLKGLHYGLRALAARRPAWGRPIDSREQLAALLAELDAQDAPALFWYGFNLAAYVRLNTDSIRIVSSAYRIADSMQRVISLAPGYYYGMAHLVLMAYQARSPALGGDPAAARQHYDEIRRINGDQFLLSDVFYARYLLCQQQDRQAFERILAAVASRPAQPAPYALLNQVARQRARLYLDAADCLFL